MTDDEIANFPDKIELVKMLLKRLQVNTDRMYYLENKVKEFQPDTVHKRLTELEQSLEQYGLTGERRWYCSRCQCRTSAVKNLSLGVGWICQMCNSPAIPIEDIDPIVTKRELENHVKTQTEMAGLIKQLNKEIVWYREHGRAHPGNKNTFSTENSRAKRSIEL